MSLRRRIARILTRTILKLLSAWWHRTRVAWKRERGFWKRTKKPLSHRHYTGAVMLLVMLPILLYVMFSIGWATMISFAFTAFLAVSYATFFSKPHIFVGIFGGVLLGRVGKEVATEGVGSALAGDFLGAIILLAVAGYIIWWSRELRQG